LYVLNRKDKSHLYLCRKLGAEPNGGSIGKIPRQTFRFRRKIRVLFGVFKVLKKRGIPTDGLRPKKLEEIPLKELDYIFTLCAEEECSKIPNVEKKFLVTPDPAKASGTPEEVEKNI
jgi:hypothetical protein